MGGDHRAGRGQRVEQPDCGGRARADGRRLPRGAGADRDRVRGHHIEFHERLHRVAGVSGPRRPGAAAHHRRGRGGLRVRGHPVDERRQHLGQIHEPAAVHRLLDRAVLRNRDDRLALQQGEVHAVVPARRARVQQAGQWLARDRGVRGGLRRHGAVHEHLDRGRAGGERARRRGHRVLRRVRRGRSALLRPAAGRDRPGGEAGAGAVRRDGHAGRSRQRGPRALGRPQARMMRRPTATMHDRELAGHVLEHVDVDRAVALTQEVCRIPSVLGEEGPLAAFLADTMKEAGFDAVQLQPVLPDRPNALGEVSFGPGRRVVLTGHLDTKPVSHGWTAAGPFSGDIGGDAVYGHGIMDMKAALACEIAAIEAVAASGLPLSGTAAMAAVSDHMGDQSGAIACFDANPADLCVLGELTDNQICLGHRGRYYFDITVLGRAAHSCHKHLAINANTLAAHVVLALDASRYEPDLPADVREMFGPETYVVPGRIYGGLPPGGPSMIPDECVIRVDCRPQPGVTVDQVRAEIERCLAEAAAADERLVARVELADVKDGYLAGPEDEVVRLMRRAVAAIRPGEPRLVTESWLGDTASFGAKVPTVIFGPGGPPVYCPDEHLPIADIHEATRAYAVFTALALTRKAAR